MYVLGFVSKIDFLVIKITNFIQTSGYIDKLGALGSEISTPKAYEAFQYHFFITIKKLCFTEKFLINWKN